VNVNANQPQNYALVIKSLRVLADSPEWAEDHSPDFVEATAASSPSKKHKADDSDDNNDKFALLMSPSKKARAH
jgi:hypothetical protein